MSAAPGSVRRGPLLLLAAAVALPGLACAVLATAKPPARQAADAEAFQRLVGGLGLGPAVDLSRCALEFDPRAGRACALGGEPVPCGSLFCPAHARG